MSNIRSLPTVRELVKGAEERNFQGVSLPCGNMYQQKVSLLFDLMQPHVISPVVYRRVSFMVWEYVAELPIRIPVDGFPSRKDALSGVITGPFRLAIPH
ncbi:hypothetical protein CEXT_76771 [Caerostris extrusa]|uniref:Uncharacterized protein n=1 Tax=Caerostris extrusa TaxID=172846 RepID=A0AAV4V9D5_CAEEX|nr:hypothetical protein CEXT_76771 [Caerostris extrusa]